uniref:Uncharacterized protein n=1 Tax=Setaria italica TaxID=4555 RepID=K3ZBH5_SETIT
MYEKYSFTLTLPSDFRIEISTVKHPKIDIASSKISVATWDKNNLDRINYCNIQKTQLQHLKPRFNPPRHAR